MVRIRSFRRQDFSTMEYLPLDRFVNDCLDMAFSLFNYKATKKLLACYKDMKKDNVLVLHRLSF